MRVLDPRHTGARGRMRQLLLELDRETPRTAPPVAVDVAAQARELTAAERFAEVIAVVERVPASERTPALWTALGLT